MTTPPDPNAPPITNQPGQPRRVSPFQMWTQANQAAAAAEAARLKEAAANGPES